VQSRLDCVGEEQRAIARAQTELDAMELAHIFERRTVEAQWHGKVKLVDGLRVQADECDELLAQVARLRDAVGHGLEDCEVLATTREALTRRSAAVEAERVNRFATDPEIVFHRGNAAGKQAVVTERGEKIGARQATAAERRKGIDGGESDADALRARVRELEDETARVGTKMAQSAEVLKAEQALLDQALATLPIDQKIRIISLL
jgi:hypothetical protein